MIAFRNLDDMLAVPAPVPRTPAQRRASRLNGGKSRGPVTAAGKAIVARNGMKKGLLAGMIAPPGDYTRGKLQYERIHRGLLKQYQPRDVIGHTLVEALAGEMLRLARANQYDNTLQQPAPLPEADATRLQEIERVQGLHELQQSIAARCRAGKPLRCTWNQAVEAAEHLLTVLSDLEAEFGDIQAEVEADETPATMVPSEREWKRQQAEKAREVAEFELLQDLLRTVAPVAERFRAPGYLARLLAGRQPLRSDERVALLPLVEKTAENFRGWLVGQEGLLRKIRAAEDDHLLRLALAPQVLMLQQAYRAGIERSIRLNIAQLERRQSPGSSR
jgi:hypothetical protein